MYSYLFVFSYRCAALTILADLVSVIGTQLAALTYQWLPILQLSPHWERKGNVCVRVPVCVSACGMKYFSRPANSHRFAVRLTI